MKSQEESIACSNNTSDEQREEGILQSAIKGAEKLSDKTKETLRELLSTDQK